MENNTPPAYQRNRRAGRIAPLPEAQLEAASTPAQTVQPPQTAQPATPYPQTAQQPAAQPSAQPYNAAPPCARNARQAYSAGLAPTHQQRYVGNHPPRALQQRPASDWRMPAPQPTARRSDDAPLPVQRRQETRTVPAGARPRAAETSRTRMLDDPDARRAAQQERRRARPEKTAAPQPAERQKTPSWLLTMLSVAVILVMALLACDFLMQAYLKTAADEKQAAYESILYNYHVTEQEDGSLRVTWQDTIEKYAAQYNLQPAFVTAVIRNESSFRTDAVSSAGARGLMQMMPDTAEWVAGKLNDSYDVERLFDVETSIRYGCWYLNYLSELFRGDPILVSAAYHAGQGEVWGWLGDPAISPDGLTVPIENIPISNTKTYAGRVTQAYGIYQTLLYPEDAFPASAAAEPGDGGYDAVSHASAAR